MITTSNLELTYTPQQLDLFFESDDFRFIVVPKGRRFGATQGGIYASLEWALEGFPVLWGDTVNGNIDRYVERFAKPVLVKHKIPYNYNAQQKKLTFPFSDGFIDFRSADRPENWEGFGYRKIILNEAGIILKNDYLYTNAVLPMMIDQPNSQLYALGVPKGKRKKDNKEHKFYTLYLSALNGEQGYRLLTYTSYDNPLLSKTDIAYLEEEIRKMNPVMVDQEIKGMFVDESFDALWEVEMIKRTGAAPYLERTVIAVDPSTTKRGDEVGIIATGKGGGKFYQLKDYSGNYSPSEWGKIVANAVQIHDADAIVIETNQGGEMAKNIIRQFDKRTRVIEIHAVKAKQVRAEPIVSLYEEGKVYHLPGLHKLENEMLTWIPGTGKSPNRIDAAVYGVQELSDTGMKGTAKPKPARVSNEV